MKNRVMQILAIALFVGYLVVMLLGTLLLPRQDFSPQEKRYLAEFPRLDWEQLTSGAWGEKIESWLADHVPGRSLFVGINAYKDYLLGQQVCKEIRVLDGHLVEAPATVDDARVENNLRAIDAFAGNNENVTLALVPSAGWAFGGEGWKDDAVIAGIYEKAAVNTLDLAACYEGRPELFYRTDHHWTSAGAWEAYRAIGEAWGWEIKTEFDKEVIADCFRGSTYSRSALWLTEPESIELWHGSPAINYTLADAPEHYPVFARDRLTESDPYTVFLDGNHPLVRLHNPNGTGKILVIRDSYSNCLGSFLAESCAEVVLVDLRYYRQPISALAEEGFDHILILYSLGNFLTDPNIVLLR